MTEKEAAANRVASGKKLLCDKCANHGYVRAMLIVHIRKRAAAPLITQLLASNARRI